MPGTQILWIRIDDKTLPLSRVAEMVFKALGISLWEGRESSNRPNGYYFAGYAENAVLEVEDRDEEEAEHEYRFQVIIKVPPWRTGPGWIPQSAPEVASVLSQNRFAVFQPSENWARADWDRSGKKDPG